MKQKQKKYLLGLLVPSLAGGAGKAWAVTMASEDFVLCFNLKRQKKRQEVAEQRR